jgi:hypothetical protein
MNLKTAASDIAWLNKVMYFVGREWQKEDYPK